MAGFTEAALSKKLSELNSSQQSIQTLSLWLIHHRKHHATIVNVWFKELQKAKDSRKLVFMYLANDVIQNSKRKGPEFGKEFGVVLRKAFENMAVPENDEKTRKSLGRILDIWGERGVYDQKLITEFKKGLEVTNKKEPESTPPPKKKQKVDVKPEADNGTEKSKSGKEKSHHKSHTTKKGKTKPPSGVASGKKLDTEVEVEVDGMKELHVVLSSQTPAADPPEPEELINALQELENSASSDAIVREKISSLPPEVSEVQLLSKLQGKADAENLSVQVNEAVQLLEDYNKRLATEMEDRRRVTAMLKEFIQAQRDLLTQAEQRLEEYTEKLDKVHAVKQEVKSHIQNLPDLTQLPDVTGGGLAPLPSAGDLFSLH